MRAGRAARRLPPIAVQRGCGRRDAVRLEKNRGGSAAGRGKRPAVHCWQELDGATHCMGKVMVSNDALTTTAARARPE